MDRKLINVILLGFAFMLVFTAFQTMGNIQKTILDSIRKEKPDFKGDGYTSLAIIYAVLSIFNWTAPSFISVVGPKIAMIVGSFTYMLFIMNFLLEETWVLYVASVVVGIGAAMIWTGQGNYLTLCSTPATISRNSGISWAMLQISMFIGNTFVFFKFQGKTEIDSETRTTVIWVLSGISIVGVVFFLLLPRAKKEEGEDEPEERIQGPIEALKGAWNLLFTKRMLLLVTTFFYTGLELSFYSGVYSSSIGFTKQFGDISKQLVGMSGIFIGVGEILGGGLFGIFGKKMDRFGRDPIVVGGFIIHIIAFFLIFLNLPNSAPFEDTMDTAFITSSAELAMFCSFLLGFGDACFNTQIYSMLCGVFSTNSASAFAIFKFTQSVAAAACFVYASAIGLYIQLGILLLLAVIGTSAFVKVEWEVKKERRIAQDTDNHSVSEVSSDFEKKP